jgi:uncharacterized protein involved in outer membrane biogenesis
MKRPYKLLYFILAAILVIFLVIVVAVGLFANSALKVAVETAGTKALNVKVSVGKVDLSFLSGTLDLENLMINNPPGYQHEKLLELSQADITVDTRSLLNNIINIREIKLDGAKVVLEQRGVSSNNLQDIIKQLPAKQEQPSEPGGKKLHIDTLEITNTQVSVKLLPVPGKIDTIPLKLGTIKMTNLGNDNNLDTVTLIRTILLAIAGGIVQQGGDILPKEMIGSLVSQLSNVGTLPGALLDTGGKILKTGTDIGKGATDAGKDLGKGITEGLKGLLKSKEEEEKKE